MNLRGLATLVILASLILLGAASATWTSLQDSSTFGDADAGQTATIDRTTDVSGAELAGGLFAIGLGGIALAGPLMRWRKTGVAVTLAGAGGLALTATAWPEQGVVTAAPGVAVAACAALCILGVLAVRLDASPARAQTPSRYTVEAVRGDAGGAEHDEWDAAVLDDPAVAEDES